MNKLITGFKILLLSLINISSFSQTVGDYNLLIVNGSFGSNAQAELTSMGHSVFLENPSNIVLGYDYSPYDAIIFMYDSPSPSGISEIIALNESCQLGVIFFRGQDLIIPLEMGNSVFWSSTDFTIQNNSHWITSPFTTGIFDLGFTYKSNITSAMPNTTILGSVEAGNGSLVVHNDYKRVMSPYYGHTDGMPWSIDGGILMDRIIAWAVEPCCANSANSLTETACFTYTVPSGDETYTFSGTQTVMDTIPNNCGADSVLTISLTLNQLDLNVTQTGFVLSSDMSGVSYQWIDCNSMTSISGANNQTFTATADGDFAVIVNDGSCSDTSTCYSISGLGLNKFYNSSYSIFPNPSNSYITIQTEEKIDQISIFTATGELVLIENKTTINVENLAKGIYIVSINTESGTSRLRFVKE